MIVSKRYTTEFGPLPGRLRADGTETVSPNQRKTSRSLVHKDRDVMN